MAAEPGKLAPDWVTALSAALHPPDTPPSRLPVTGYRPARGSWRPRPAAVLVAITSVSSPRVILTVRSERLAHHAGQVAFPGGGRSHPGEGPVETALREAREEVGLEPERIQPLGFLDRFDTISGFRMVPVVGWVRGPVEFNPDPGEVSTIFSVPLARVLETGSYREHRVDLDGREHQVYSLEHPDHLIWGATAAVLHQLCLRGQEAA